MGNKTCLGPWKHGGFAQQFYFRKPITNQVLKEDEKKEEGERREEEDKDKVEEVGEVEKKRLIRSQRDRHR